MGLGMCSCWAADPNPGQAPPQLPRVTARCSTAMGPGHTGLLAHLQLQPCPDVTSSYQHSYQPSRVFMNLVCAALRQYGRPYRQANSRATAVTLRNAAKGLGLMRVNPPLNRFQVSCCDDRHPKAGRSVLNY